MPTDTPPGDAVCIEQGCDYPATTTRTATQPWLYEGGVITQYDEWVCVYHATPTSTLTPGEH